MSFLQQVDVLVLTWNEAPNLRRTLAALARFPRVWVLDSGSTDETANIAQGYPNVRVAQREFDTHAAQWNHALGLPQPGASWVLALDADYVLSAAGVQEIESLSIEAADAQGGAQVSGYRARFVYRVLGRALSGSLYPPVCVLFRRDGARYEQDGHTQRLVPALGRVLELSQPIAHDDRKPLERWLSSQLKYARLECDRLRTRDWSALSWRDRLRRMVVVTPWLVPLFALVVRGGLLDGRAGLYYALQRGLAESLLALCLLEALLRPVGETKGESPERDPRHG